MAPRATATIGYGALRAGKSGGIAELVASVEPADTHGGKRDGAGRPSIADMVQAVEPAKVHDGNNQDANGNLNNRKTKGSHKSETIIARLKRDAETDTHAAALLGSIEAGDIKPYRAASFAIASRIILANLRPKACAAHAPSFHFVVRMLCARGP